MEDYKDKKNLLLACLRKEPLEEKVTFLKKCNAADWEETITEAERHEIGRVIIKTQKLVFYDPYARNKPNGSFIIINQLTKSTAEVGIIWYQPGRLPNK